MALGDNDAPEPLARAARVLRSAPEPGWDAIEDDVIEAVRATPRGGWPVSVVDPAPGSAPGAIMVSDLVLRSALARRLRQADGYELARIDVEIDDARQALRSVRVELTGRYGTDLNAAIRHALDQCTAVILDVVGAVDGVLVDVAVTDVTR